MKKSVPQWRRWCWRGWCLVAVLLTVFVFTQLPLSVNLKVLQRLVRLTLMVGAATFVGTIFEIRNWTGFARLLLKPLINFARLPQIVGAAMITALFSNYAAGGVLAGSFAEGRISRFEMRVGAICNSYAAYVSHSFRIMYPVIGALGLPGLYYFGLIFGAGFLITLTALTVCRYRPQSAISADNGTAATNIDERTTAAEMLSWPQTLTKSWVISRNVLIRVLWVTIPLYLLASYFNCIGIFQVWKEFVPEVAAPFFPPEVLAIMAARLGGLVSAAGVAFELHSHGSIGCAQILLALLVGNLITNPVRMLRRSLPTAMGIFPPRDGFFIVAVMQFSRLLFVILYIVILIAWLYLQQG
jgi:hypothetical protein